MEESAYDEKTLKRLWIYLSKTLTLVDFERVNALGFFVPIESWIEERTRRRLAKYLKKNKKLGDYG